MDGLIAEKISREKIIKKQIDDWVKPCEYCNLPLNKCQCLGVNVPDAVFEKDIEKDTPNEFELDDTIINELAEYMDQKKQKALDNQPKLVSALQRLYEDWITLVKQDMFDGNLDVTSIDKQVRTILKEIVK